MKTAICFLAIVGFAAAGRVETYSISSSIQDAVEGIRDQLPCGIPALGIPPAAPLRIDYKDIKVDTPKFKLIGSVRNFTLEKLNEFDIVQMKVNVVKSKFTFNLLFKNIIVDTLYDLESFFQDFGLTVKVIGAGQGYFALNNFEVTGSVKYSISFITNRVKVKKIEVTPRLGSVTSNIKGVLGRGTINHKMNEALEVFVPLMVNENANLISQKIEAELLPKINEELYKYTLDELMALAGGSSSEDESVPCVPTNP